LGFDFHGNEQRGQERQDGQVSEVNGLTTHAPSLRRNRAQLNLISAARGVFRPPRLTQIIFPSPK
jgi:hypothetical protein